MLGSKTLLVSTIFSVAFSITSANAQAFGVEKGQSLEGLTIKRDFGDGVYEVTVPSPHSEFEAYAVRATPETGVCTVRGVGKNHENDRYGISVQNAFSSLRSVLESRYNKHEFGDVLRSGAIWDGREYWVMALRQNERIFEAVWAAKYQSDLPDGLDEIILRVSAVSKDTAYIILQYRFNNDEECSRVLSKKDEGGL